MSQKIHAGHLTHLKETFENEKKTKLVVFNQNG